MQTVYPDLPINNIGGVVLIDGLIDLDVLEEAINASICQIQTIRTVISKNKKGEWTQSIAPYQAEKIQRHEFVDMSEFNEWVDLLFSEPSAFINERLYQFNVFSINGTKSGYVLKFNHVICDGWGANIVTEFIHTYYRAIIGKAKKSNKWTSAGQPALKPEYEGLKASDIVKNEANYIASKRYVNGKEFWHSLYKDIPSPIFQNNPSKYDTDRVLLGITDKLTQEIEEYCDANGISLSVFFKGCFLVYLHRVHQIKELILGIPTLNRKNKHERATFGMYVALLPYRSVIDFSSSFVDFCDTITKGIKPYYKNQAISFEEMIPHSVLGKNGRVDFVQVCFNYYNTKHPEAIDGMAVENIERTGSVQQFLQQLVVRRWQDNFELAYDYRKSEFSRASVREILNSIVKIIEQVLENNRAKLRDISIISNNDYQEIVKEYNKQRMLNNVPDKTNVVNRFDARVDHSPEKIAIFADYCDRYIGQRISFKDLRDRSNTVVQWLQYKGIKQQQRVAIAFTHEPDVIACILGIMKVGAVFVPVDYSSPKERIGYIFDDASCCLLISNVVDVLNTFSESVPLSKIFEAEIELEIITKNIDSKDLCYIIYTSGSTGRPKGVAISHESLSNYIDWCRDNYLDDYNDIFAVYSPLHFDLTITSLMVPLTEGVAMDIYSDRGEYLIDRIIEANRSTILKLTPTHLSILASSFSPITRFENQSLATLIVGGEQLSTSLSNKIIQLFGVEISIINEYGPTEATIGCAYHLFNHEKDTGLVVPIGIPIYNTKFYVLDEFKKLLPKGCVGELYIEGKGLAKGYLGSEELTNNSFLQIRAENIDQFDGIKRAYRTGDLVSFNELGKLVYHGRKDKQIKINGYRVEISEIESVIMEIEEVEFVTIIPTSEHLNSFLFCYYMLRNSSVNPKVDENTIRSYLKTRLPLYMVPKYYQRISEIPVTVNGKFDLSSLPDYELSIQSSAAKNHQINEKSQLSDGDSLNEIGIIVIQHISEITNKENIDLENDFFGLGGDSIQAIQLSNRLSHKKIDLKVSDIMSANSIAEMIAVAETSVPKKAFYPISLTSFEATPIIHWFLNQNFVRPEYYCQSVMLTLKGHLSEHEIESCLNYLVNYHDGLRINREPGSNFFYYNSEHVNSFNLLSFRTTTNSLEDENRLSEFVKYCEKIKANFLLEKDLLFKGVLFKKNDDDTYLLLIAHHLVVDGVSWQILIDDLDVLISQSKRQEEFQLPEKTMSYAEWGQRIGSDKFANVFFKENERHSLGRVQRIITLPKELVEKVYKLNFDYKVSPSIVILLNLINSVSTMLGRDNMNVELEEHGRDACYEVSRTVGWFTRIRTIRFTDFSNQHTIEKFKQVKNGINNIEEGGCISGGNKANVLRYNYLGDIASLKGTENISLSDVYTGKDVSDQNNLDCMLELNVLSSANQIELRFVSDVELDEKENLGLLVSQFVCNLNSLMEEISQTEHLDFELHRDDHIEISESELDSIFV